MRELILTLLVGLVVGWTANGLRYELRIEKTEKAQALERAGHIALIRAEERRRAEEMEEVQHDAQKEIERIAADAAAADRAADGLQRELAAVRGRLAKCSTAAGGSPAAANPGVLLADMLGEMERAGRALAAEADRRGVAGVACMKAYQSLSH